MQFSLRSLFLIVTGLALFCGVVFSLPVMATGLVLALTLLVSPAVWVSGASFASEGKRAFFRGGLVCGILPFVACGYGLMQYMGGVALPIYSSSLVRQAYPVAVTSPGSISPTQPSYYPADPTGPGEAPTMPDNSPPSDAATRTIGETPATTSDTTPQTVYVSETFNVPSISDSGPVPDGTVQTPSQITSTYAETLGMRLTLAAIWLAPGFFSFCGGAISYGTYRLVRPAPPPADARPGVVDYQVVQGRLTTVSPVSAPSGSD